MDRAVPTLIELGAHEPRDDLEQGDVPHLDQPRTFLAQVDDDLPGDR